MNFDDGILYNYNIEAYKKLMKAMEEDGRACAIHSTGTGKMYLALKWLVDNKDSSFAYVAPTNVILDKFLDVIIEECFSDKKEELYACKTIEKRVEKVEKLLGNKVHLLTYAGINKKVKKGKVKLKVDKIVLDEFHHLGADQWGSAVETFLKFNDEAEVLGLSATPIRGDKKNMVDELFNGKIASEITLKDALEKSILPVPTFIGAIYSFEEEISKLENKFKVRRYSKETQEKIEKYIKEARKILEEAGGLKEVFDFALTQVKDSKNAKFIVFCSDMDDKDNKMIEAKNWFDGSINIRSVDYSLGKKENLNVIKEFEEDTSVGIKLLFSIDMLNEGLHIKDIDGVIMMRPTTSDIIFHQQLGRALASGIKEGVKPVVLDLVNNIDVLVGDISNIRGLIIQYGGSVYGGKQNQIPDFKVQERMIDIVNHLRGIAYTFEERIAPLVAYHKEHGSIINIKSNDIYKYEGNEVNVGNLISNLRKAYKARKLSKEQIKVLENLGIVWEATVTFEERIAPLVAYYKEYGSIANIKKGDVFQYEGKEINIRELIYTFRKQYKLSQKSELEYKESDYSKSKHRPLTKDEISKLESIGMVWNARVTFEERIDSLVAYYKEYGTIKNIKSGEIYKCNGNEVNVGNLISNLRQDYKSEKLSKEEIKLLENIGMVWDTRVTFAERIAPLVSYYEKYGSIGNIKKREVYEYEKQNIKIGSLIGKFRNDYKSGNLDQNQITTLESMGMRWDKVITFEERIAPLVSYYKEQGSIINVKSGDIYKFEGNEVNVGNLIYNLRQDYKSEKLSKEEIKFLENIGMVWDTRVTFEKRIDSLVAYYKEYGTIKNIKSGDIYKYKGNEANVGNLISNLRKDYKSEKLSEEEIKILEKIGMVWEARVTFEERIAPLVAYYKEHGTIANIKKNYIFEYEEKKVNIGELICTIREQYRLSKLSEEEYEECKKKKGKINLPLTADQIKIIESMGIVWETKATFEERIAPLVAYYKEHGLIKNIKRNETYEFEGKEVKIGLLINNLRTKYTLRKLSEEEIKILESIGMVWSPSKNSKR